MLKYKKREFTKLQKLQKNNKNYKKSTEIQSQLPENYKRS